MDLLWDKRVSEVQPSSLSHSSLTLFRTAQSMGMPNLKAPHLRRPSCVGQDARSCCWLDGPVVAFGSTWSLRVDRASPG